MQNLTPAGQNLVSDISYRFGISQDAVIHMLVAVNNGNGTMAQFNCPELGGSGQWMQGGMTMVGDMFNNGLKNTVDNLCSELANALANMQLFPPAPANSAGGLQWWPGDLGQPFSSGAQNNIRYAVFPNRLAVELNGAVTVYDTLNHNIGGVSQQQGSNTSLSFSSQFGEISVDTLPVISGSSSQQGNTNQDTVIGNNTQVNFAEPSNLSQNAVEAPQNDSNYGISTASSTQDEIFILLEKLGKLFDAGVLTQDEFNAKKAELLNRI
ncbi:SHOCT domain-containing protein [Marinomonas balearica]|uniref:Putative oligomerization/nucleic acid binding protein n=1 Tax=Marinomonas balearica TaxID=491947 RepID=A0A4R6MH81_9GAMM|nr:SHOCT domain-containing protein [Marinomonas balearica]TDO99519.1 putative oligomerization/nucleic acid binding protein [Marinomonas balearica]